MSLHSRQRMHWRENQECHVCRQCKSNIYLYCTKRTRSQFMHHLPRSGFAWWQLRHGNHGWGEGWGATARRGVGDVAQLEQHWTVMPLRQLPLPGVARIFLSASTFSADSLMKSTQPSCAIPGINICAYVKDPKHWQPYHCLDTRKYRLHRNRWSCSCSCCSLTQDKATQISHKGLMKC